MFNFFYFYDHLSKDGLNHCLKLEFFLFVFNIEDEREFIIIISSLVSSFKVFKSSVHIRQFHISWLLLRKKFSGTIPLQIFTICKYRADFECHISSYHSLPSMQNKISFLELPETVCKKCELLSFQFKIGKMVSSPRRLELIVCVQGSVLGPILFNTHLNDMLEIINADLVFSCADDTYVIISGNERKHCEQKLASSIANHLSYLKTRGMILQH